MSLVKRILEDISTMNSPEGMLSGRKYKDKDGDLAPHPTVNSIDPIAVRGADSDKDKKKFDSDLEKRMKGGDLDDKLTESKD